ncbi:MAG: hypothetical protein HW401_857 [Parcubacteria group bacterium]|nr:hypothetical protein [Parcubacteria group bacterium]
MSFLLLKSKKEVATKVVSEVKVVKNPVEVLDIDSDGDGLKDWEETLWKLDPKNPDTDGNGIPDAEEVKKKIAEIGAKGETGGSGSEAAESETYTTDTETDILSKKLFAEYINLKQSGNFNEEAVIATVNNLVAEEIQNKKDTQYYFLKDIKTFSFNDKALLKSYGNSFATIRIKYKNQYIQNPLVKEGGVANLLDPEFIQGLVRTSEVYRNMAVELSKIAAPKDLADIHMEILNNYMASSDGLKELSALSTDPVKGMIGTQRHIEAEEKEKNLLSDVAEYLSDNGIIFSGNEAGNMWNNI